MGFYAAVHTKRKKRTKQQKHIVFTNNSCATPALLALLLNLQHRSKGNYILIIFYSIFIHIKVCAKNIRYFEDSEVNKSGISPCKTGHHNARGYRDVDKPSLNWWNYILPQLSELNVVKLKHNRLQTKPTWFTKESLLWNGSLNE